MEVELTVRGDEYEQLYVTMRDNGKVTGWLNAYSLEEALTKVTELYEGRGFEPFRIWDIDQRGVITGLWLEPEA